MADSTVSIPNREFKLLQRSIHNQRLQLELALETMPREVYSNQLMEAMRREEMAMRDGVKVTNESAKGIDDMLRNETSKFYRKISKENEKRWKSLQEKVSNEYNRFYQSSRAGSGSRGAARAAQAATTTASASTDGAKDAKMGSSTDNNSSSSSRIEPVQDINSVPSSQDLDDEVLRLEEDYNRNWLQYEGSNLNTAFRSQMERVEMEWSSHEQNLNDDYNRKKITEKIGHNREKVSAAKTPQQKKQYNQNLEMLQAQKSASQRWMSRQEIRLSAQAGEVALERKNIGELLNEERKRANSRA